MSKHEAILKCKSLIGPNGNTVNSATQAPIQSQVTENERVQILTAAFTYFQQAYEKSEAAQAYLQSRSLEHLSEVGYHDGKLSKSLKTSLLKLDIVAGWGKGCIIFPLKNEAGEIVSLYGRSITDQNKSRHFYSTGRQGLYPGYPDPKTTKYLILTESVLDAASLPLPANTSVLALYGTNGLTAEHKKVVKELDMLHEIILFFDGDEAGRKAMRSQAEALWKIWKLGKISSVPTPDGEDINSLSVAYGGESEKVPPSSESPHNPSHNASIFFHLLNQKQVLYSGGEAKVSTPAAPSAPAPAFKFDTSHPQKRALHTTKARYQVQGKLKLELDTMRVTLFIYSPSGTKSRHKLDLFENRQIEKCARECSEKLGIAYELVLLDLNHLADALEGYRDQQIAGLQSESSDKPKAAALTPALQKECLGLLKSPELMRQLNDKIGACGVVGEEMNRLLLFCVASSYKMPRTLHAIVQGSSGSGKTHLLNAILELMPRKMC